MLLLYTGLRNTYNDGGHPALLHPLEEQQLQSMGSGALDQRTLPMVSQCHSKLF